MLGERLHHTEGERSRANAAAGDGQAHKAELSRGNCVGRNLWKAQLPAALVDLREVRRKYLSGKLFSSVGLVHADLTAYF